MTKKMRTEKVTDINRLAAHYLMHSYLYYKKNISLISDDSYDYICKTLHTNYNQITHPHKEHIDKEQLLCGSGYSIDYPSIVKGAANNLITIHKEYKKLPYWYKV